MIKGLSFFFEDLYGARGERYSWKREPWVVTMFLSPTGHRSPPSLSQYNTNLETHKMKMSVNIEKQKGEREKALKDREAEREH